MLKVKVKAKSKFTLVWHFASLCVLFLALCLLDAWHLFIKPGPHLSAVLVHTHELPKHRKQEENVQYRRVLVIGTAKNLH